ncbi:MAG: MoaD/ThiS family protein [Sciscionella sp.]
MTQVMLSGYPEAVLGRGRIAVLLPTSALAGDAMRAVATRHPKLREALLHEDGQARRNTKTLINGTVVDATTPIPAGAPVTVLAALPCDG